MQLTVDLPINLVTKLSTLPDSNHFITTWLNLGVLLIENNHYTLDDIAKSISEKATQKGLTEEKLRELLENDQ
jgi:microsomal dipeptidase-like Zn-dependent dipeptidase